MPAIEVEEQSTFASGAGNSQSRIGQWCCIVGWDDSLETVVVDTAEVARSLVLGIQGKLADHIRTSAEDAAKRAAGKALEAALVPCSLGVADSM